MVVLHLLLCILQSEYADCMKSGIWQKRLEFPDGESVIMHNAAVVVHFCQAAAPDDWGNLPVREMRICIINALLFIVSGSRL